MLNPDDQIRRIEAAIRADPGGRGLLRSPRDPLGLGELGRAAGSLATAEGRILIVTGFYIPSAQPPAAETDGPPGAIALAGVLARLGIDCSLLTDRFCAASVAAGITAAGLDPNHLHVLETEDELKSKRPECLRDVSHLIAVERPGPTYDLETMERRWGNEAGRDFARTTPRDHWLRPLNMRGQRLDNWTLDFAPLFENPPTGLTTIGIGDGGNEIGMGKFAWSSLSRRLDPNQRGRPSIVSRVACDHTILAGTSNWGAWGLAAALAVMRGNLGAFSEITLAGGREILESMVRYGPAVDGVTGRAEPTVDGLSLDEYEKPLLELRSIIGEPRV